MHRDGVGSAVDLELVVEISDEVAVTVVETSDEVVDSREHSTSYHV